MKVLALPYLPASGLHISVLCVDVLPAMLSPMVTWCLCRGLCGVRGAACEKGLGAWTFARASADPAPLTLDDHGEEADGSASLLILSLLV